MQAAAFGKYVAFVFTDVSITYAAKAGMSYVAGYSNWLYLKSETLQKTDFSRII